LAGPIHDDEGHNHLFKASAGTLVFFRLKKIAARRKQGGSLYAQCVDYTNTIDFNNNRRLKGQQDEDQVK